MSTWVGQPFSCGCEPDGMYRCKRHENWPCHTGEYTREEWEDAPKCLPCWLADMRGVYISSTATPTRNRR